MDKFILKDYGNKIKLKDGKAICSSKSNNNNNGKIKWL